MKTNDLAALLKRTLCRKTPAVYRTTGATKASAADTHTLRGETTFRAMLNEGQWYGGGGV